MSRPNTSPEVNRNEGNPKYTIVIPTRNGIKYLPYAIESVLSQNYRNFELIVSNNWSSDGTSDYLSTLADIRLRCIAPPSLLSMAAHFEFAVSQARGEWITTIGDDDGLLPEFFENFDKLGNELDGINSVVFERAYFFWENCDTIYGDAVVSYGNATYKDTINSKLALFFALISLIDYIELPQLYTSGMVRKTFYDKIKAKSGGNFFNGPTPDASSAAALALNSHRHMRVGRPLFWTGTSTKSVGFSQSSTGDTTRAEEFNQLNRKDNNLRTDKIPNEILKIHNFAVILYEAILLDRTASWIWSSKLMRLMFLAGLIRRDAKLTTIVNSIVRGKIDQVLLRNCVRMISILARKMPKIMNRDKLFIAQLTFNSNDRVRYPDLHAASETVKKLHAQYPGQ